MATSPPTLTLSADQSEVNAGGTMLLTAVLAHSGAETGEYRLSVRGVDAAWVTLYPETLTVAAGGQATATMLVAPPVNAAAADLALVMRAEGTGPNAVAEATFSVRLMSTTSGSAGRARGTRRLTWPRLLLATGCVVVVIAAVGAFFLWHRHPASPPQHTADCASQSAQVVDLYSDDTTTAIRISDPDLADVRILRTEPSDTLSPLFSSLLALSPDGTHLAYVTAGNEALDDAHLWSLDIANPAQRQELATIPHGLWQVRPAWSPDNKQVVFLRLNEQQAAASQSQLELWVAEVGGQPHKVAAPTELRPDGFYGSGAQSLCWAQDNQSVIFPSVAGNTPPDAQGARATGTQDAAGAPAAGAPHQVAVNVQTGVTEDLATPPAAPDAAPTAAAAPVGGGANCGLPVFSQNDPAWRNIIMQSSGDTIGKFGCAVTATAMLLNYYGTAITPAQLNTCLGDKADLIVWASVVPCANGGVSASNAFDFAWPSLDQVLASGNPAIVGMVRGQTGLHFVVVTGGGGGEATNYSVIDPWDGTTSKTLQTFLDAGYNLRWIRTYTGTDKACPRLVAPQTPAADASGVTPLPDGPLLVPSQLLPLFAKVADQTGVPRELLLALARIESGFTPRAVGPLIERFQGTEDAHALGMMQFLPSTYRGYSQQVDAARLKSAGSAGTYHALSLTAQAAGSAPLGDAGIWDPESSIWAAAFFLQQHNVAKDPHGALFAYNNSDAYVETVLKAAQQFKAGTIPDPNMFDPNGTSKPGTLAAPNPLNPPPLSPEAAAAAQAAAPAPAKQANGGNGGNAGASSSGGSASGGGAPGGAGGTNGGANGTTGTTATGASGGKVPIKWSFAEGSISRAPVTLNFNATDDIGEVLKLSLFTLTVPGSTASPVNQSTPSRPFTAGTVVSDDGVYEAVAVTRAGGQTRVSRRKFTIDRTPPNLDVSVISAGGTPATATATGATQAVTTAETQRAVADGAIRLKISYADTLSGVTSVEYRIDGGDWQLYFNAVAFKGDALIDVPGDHTITVRATDVAGNVSPERSLDFTVKPTGNTPPLLGGQPTLKPVSSTLTTTSPVTIAQTIDTTATASAAPTATTVPAVTPTAVVVTPTPNPVLAATGTAAALAGTPALPTATVAAPTTTGALNPIFATRATPTATVGVTATADTTPTVGATPTVTVTPVVTPTVAPTATSAPTATQTALQQTATAATPTTTGTATAVTTATPSPQVKVVAPSCADAPVKAITSCTAATITNTGTTDLHINNINTTGEFLLGDAGSSCTTALTPNASCDIPILFVPTAIGKRLGSLTITSSAPDSPTSITLTGNGKGAPAVAFAPQLITCPDTLIRQSSSCSLTLTNTGSAGLTIAPGYVVTGDFAPDPLNSNCGPTLDATAHCTISVIFTPTVQGTRTGLLTITDTAPGSPQYIPMMGKGLAPGFELTSASLAITPSSISCVPTPVGQSSDCGGPLTLRNNGDGELDVRSIIPHDDFIKIGDTAGCAVLQPTKSCIISVSFAPTTRGTHVSGITFNDNVIGSPQTVQVTGIGLAPVVDFGGVASLTCGTTSTSLDAPYTGVVVGTSSDCGSSVTPNVTPLTLKNSGDAPLHISSITPSNGFTIDPGGITCGPTLAVNANCTLPVKFTPTAGGTYEGGLTINDDAAGSPHTVQVTAIGLAPSVQLNGTSLTCANTSPDSSFVGVVVGTSSLCTVSGTQPTSLTLTNKGTARLNVSSIIPNDPFIHVSVNPPNTESVNPVNTNCGLVAPNLNGPILPNQVCTLTITFVPTERGTHVSGLTITDDAPGSPHSVQVTGTGLAPVVDFGGISSLTCINNSTDPHFNGVVVGTSNPCYASLPTNSLKLTNTGDADLAISSIVVGDDFKIVPGPGQCLATLPATPGRNSCTLAVTFAPTTAGHHTSSLMIADNAPGSPHSVQLAADGLAPVIAFNTQAVLCQNLAVGSTTTACVPDPPLAPPTLTLTNSGTAPLTIDSIVPSNDFTVAVSGTGCGTVIQANVTCQITVTFAPTVAGVHQGKLVIADNAPGSPHSVQLTATGLAPVVSFSASSLTCPNTIVEQTNSCLVPGTTPAPLTLTNTGDAPLSISSIVASDDFTVDLTQCPQTVAAGATCTLPVTFTPTARGTHIANLVIADNAPGAPHAVQLTGKALAPVVALNATALTCATTIVGQRTICTPTPLTVTNTGDAPLTISSIAQGNGFSVTPTGGGCGATVAPNGVCALQVAFVPTARGTYTDSLTINDNAPGSPQTIQLTGTALAPVLNLSVTSITCPPTQVGQVTPPCTPATLTLTNNGDAPLNIASIVAGDDFTVDPSPCPQSLPATTGSNSCTLPIAFAPKTAGSHVGNITITDNAPGSPHAVQLTGTGLAAVATLSTQSVNCGGTPLGSPAISCPQFILTNSGTSALTITNIVLNGDFTADASGCGTVLYPQSLCAIVPKFGPTAAGNRVGSLTITDNASNSPQVIALSGVGQAPVLTLNPTAVTCPNTNVGQTGTCSTALTLTNSGDAALTISSIVPTDDFRAVAGQCPATIAPAGTCQITITFVPGTAGSHVGGLTITDNAAGSPQSVQLTGTGLGPSLSLSTQSVACPGTLVGTTIPCPAFTLTNNGTASLTITTIVLDGNFTADASGCSTSIAANGGTCQIMPTFGPTAAGSRVGSLTITDNAPGSPQVIALSGTGQAPVLTLNPTAVTCPTTTVVGQTSTCTTTLTLTNTGDATLTISGIAASDDFKVSTPQTGGCGTTLAPNNTSCALQVTFAPTVAGNHTGSVTITDNAAGSPHAVQLTGTASAPAVSFDLASIPCPDTAINGNNPCSIVTLKNTGDAALTITSITANSPFSVAGTPCPSSLGPGITCPITVTFAPTTFGTQTGFLTIADNATGSPHKVPVSGNGIGTPAFSMTQTGSCPDTQVGQTGVCPVVTVSNASTATGNLVMSLITISSEFSIDNAGSNCGTILTPGNNCVLAIKFAPVIDGQRGGTLTITDNAPNSPQSLPLTGKGLGTPGITLAPPTTDACNDTLVGATAACPTVTVTNSGNAQLTLSRIAVTGEFALDTLTNTTCGTTVAPGASCVLAINFSPTATGARPAGSLQITDNAPGSPQTITLTGKGTQPALTLAPTAITCADTIVNTTTNCGLTVTNSGTAPLTLNPSITAGGSDYQVHTGGAGTCGATVAPTASCTLSVDFTPTTTGARPGTLKLADNAPGNPHTITLSGNGTQPAIALAPSTISCADTAVNTTGTCGQVTVRNSGTATLTLNPPPATAAPFAIDASRTTCGATVAPGASCTIAIKFLPTATGTVTGSLTITDNAPSSPHSVSLSGNSVAATPALSVPSGTTACQDTTAGQTGTCPVVTITNTSLTTAITLNLPFTATGDFAVGSTTCGTSLAASASCTLTMNFTPSAQGTRNGSATITYTLGANPQATAVIAYRGSGL